MFISKTIHTSKLHQFNFFHLLKEVRTDSNDIPAEPTGYLKTTNKLKRNQKNQETAYKEATV